MHHLCAGKFGGLRIFMTAMQIGWDKRHRRIPRRSKVPAERISPDSTKRIAKSKGLEGRSPHTYLGCRESYDDGVGYLGIVRVARSSHFTSTAFFKIDIFAKYFGEFAAGEPSGSRSFDATRIGILCSAKPNSRAVSRAFKRAGNKSGEFKLFIHNSELISEQTLRVKSLAGLCPPKQAPQLSSRS